MKKFNIHEAVLGNTVITRRGEIVADIKHFDKCEDSDFCVYGVLDGKVKNWNKEGKLLVSSDSVDDLFMQYTPTEADVIEAASFDFANSNCLEFDNVDVEKILQEGFKKGVAWALGNLK
jgi:hypothetical protein